MKLGLEQAILFLVQFIKVSQEMIRVCSGMETIHLKSKHSHLIDVVFIVYFLMLTFKGILQGPYASWQYAYANPLLKLVSFYNVQLASFQ